MFNIIAAELVFAGIFLVVLLTRWPNPPWTLLTYGGALLMVVLPILFYPFSKTLFLGFDLLFRPAGHAPGEGQHRPAASPRHESPEGRGGRP
jgi:hypothetical protein